MEQKPQEKSKKKIVFYLIPILLFLVFIAYMLIRTIPGEVETTLAETDVSVSGFVSLSDTFEDVLQDNIYDKNDFINLNGLTTRVLGINTLNEREKLTNGHLSYTFENEENISVTSANTIALNDFLSDRGIDFVYLLAPTKLAFYDIDSDFAPGYSSEIRKGYDSMISVLNEAGVTTIYMNDWYSDNGLTMDDVYYRTDTHWLPNISLAAARLTMETMADVNIIDKYDEELLEDDSYTVLTKENWFLGSHGRRVGKYYAGVDDFSVYFPDFPTNYTFAALSAGTTNWNYYDSPLNLGYIEVGEPDYFNVDVYSTYLYGDQPIQLLINSEANSDKKVLVTGDSFKRAWEYFLSSQFKEIYSVDLRHYTDGSFIQLVEELQPDIVIMCLNSVSMEEYYTFGLEGYLTALDNTIEDEEDVDILSDAVIEPRENSGSNYIQLSDGLETNQTYTLTLDATSYSGGEDIFVQMTLQDITSDTAVYNRYFDANSEEEQKWIFTVPDDTDDYAIYLYAGTKGHTQNVSVGVDGIRLRKGIFED